MSKLLIELRSKEEFIKNSYERFLAYEAYIRYCKNEAPFNIKWVQSTLKVSFPKAQSLIDNLVDSGYIIKTYSEDDNRVIHLSASKKLINGIELFEAMKINELHKRGFKLKENNRYPQLSELTKKTIRKIKKEFLG
tara:strand:+ start:636 stop:1043 length:408 start_codon:yes stop_codon:yes gene_type:complete